MTMVGEIVAKLKSISHIPRIMIPISPTVRSLDVKAMLKGRQILQKEIVATYAVGRMQLSFVRLCGAVMEAERIQAS